MKRSATWAVIGSMFLLHYLFYPIWASAPWGPDFLVPALLLMARRLPPGVAGAAGCGVGLLEASASLAAIAPTMSVLGVAAVGGSWYQRLFYFESTPSLMAFVAAGIWVVHLAEALATGDSLSLHAAFLYGPSSGLLSAVAVWLLALAGKWLSR